MVSQLDSTPGRLQSQLAALLVAIIFSSLAALPANGSDPDPLTTSDQLYELENLLKIELFMEEEDWDKVRFSWRGQYGEEIDGKWTTVESDYEHQPGDIVINGVRVGNVGIRKKGFFGSLSAQRPSLKVKLNKYVKGQEFLGIKDLTLNNNLSDEARVRQVVSYKWFRRAGIAAPRCNFARVYINGKYLGIYSNVEPLGKEFLKDHFGSSKGTLYEGTSADFQPGAVEQFEAKTNKKSDDRSALNEIARLLENVDEVDVKALGRLVDLDQFLRFWSAEMLLGHWDGYAGNRNNFFVYQNPKTDRVEFLPWGTDQSFGTHQFLSTAPPRIVRARGRLCAALYVSPTYRQRYLTTVHEMLQNWWDAPALLADVEQAAELIRPHILLRQEKFDQALATLRRYIEGTSPEITAELETPPDKWLVALPEDPTPSTEAEPAWAGTVKSTFSIPFTRYEMRDFTVLKSNALEIVWRDRPVNHPVAIGKLGYEHADPLWFETPTLLLLLHSPPDGRNVWISMKLDPDLLAKGGNIRLHKSQVTAWFGTSISGRNESINHGLLDGVLKAELVKINGTNTLNGVIDARLYSGRKELEF